MGRIPVVLAAATAAVVLVASALGHEERPAQYPPDRPGAHVPRYRTHGPVLVVCTRRSHRRILRRTHGALRRRNLRLLARCKYRNIEDAVRAARSGYRIEILPGVYRERPSRRVPLDDPKCKDDYTTASDGDQVPTYDYQRKCPRSKNLITIAGDTNGDRICDQKCNLQIEGTGARPRDVFIIGDRRKQNTIRADRADGIYLRNFKIDFADINDIYVMETNGFVIKDVVTGWARRYGVLSFTSDHGLYDHVIAYGNGDSGVYPGSGGPGDCKRYAIEIRNSDSYNNNLGYSGTAGDNVWVHDNKFHGNAAGVATDSFASGHPGMPQHCSKFERNRIYSNNNNIFTPERQQYCDQHPYDGDRNPHTLCSTFQVPVGTGMLIAGGNKDIVQHNWNWDNWRNGFMLFWVPGEFRWTPDDPRAGPPQTIDTSFDDHYLSNKMSQRPDGTRDPNGVDFWWDGEGSGNCFSGNSGPGGAAPTHRSPSFPPCPGSSVYSPGDPTMTASLAPCATWDPHSNQFPPGCDWFTTPPEPQ